MADFFEKLAGSKKVTPKVKTEIPLKTVAKTEEEGQLAVDVFQTENEIVIQSTIAGVSAEDLDITIENEMVTIAGERKKPQEIPPENYFYQECYWGPFSRSIILPEQIKAEEATAELKNGILTIKLPKAEKVKVTKLKVISS
jgi:HSP20 family protein